jgi:hypothetical protein
MTYLSDKRKQNTRFKIVFGIFIAAAALTFFWKYIVIGVSPVTLPVVQTYASSRDGVVVVLVLQTQTLQTQMVVEVVELM